MPEPTDPRVWLNHLQTKLRKQSDHAKKYDEHYSGERELAIVTADYAEVFGELHGCNVPIPRFDPPRSGAAAVGVDSAAERLVVQGFIVGDADDREGARVAERIWRRNDMDVMESVSYVESLVKASAFALVWPDRDGKAVVSVEDPEQVVVDRQMKPPYDVIAAAKFYRDAWTGEHLAVLWLPEGMREFRGGGSAEIWVPSGRTGWVETRFTAAPPQWRSVPSDPKSGRVPVVELANRQRLIRPPASDLVPVAPLADTHAKLLADLVIAASFGAIPIRTATGITLQKDPQTGEPRTPFNVRANRAMVSENADARFGAIDATDLAGYAAAMDIILREMRIVTRVPLHYYGEGASAGQSGETLKAAEASLVRRVNRMLSPYGMSWRKVMSLCLALESSDYAAAPVRTRWADTETRIESQQVDAAAKLWEKVPLEIVLEHTLGYPRELVQRAMDLRSQEQSRAEEILARIQRDDLGTANPDTPEAVPA